MAMKRLIRERTWNRRCAISTAQGSPCLTNTISLKAISFHRRRSWVNHCHSDLIRKFSKATDDVHSKWLAITNRLCETQQGRFEDGTWHEAEEILKYWTTQREDVKQCWKVLDRMGIEKDPPNRLTIDLTNTIIDVWREQFKKAVDANDEFNAEKLWLPSQVAERLSEWQDTNLLYVNGWARAMILDAASNYSQNSKEGVWFADSYLKRWIEDYENGRTDVVPDVVAIGSVIHAWAESDLPDATTRAEEWMTKTEPNAILYTNIISMWAKRGKSLKAQAWLERMEDQGLEPDLFAWNTLLKAWSRDRQDPSSAEKAETILWKMRQLHENGALESPPDIISYSSVLDAWAKKALNDPKASDRAQSLFEQMKNEVPPNTISYNIVITAHARAGNAHLAEALLQEMIEDASKGNTDVEPNVKCFSSVLAGWSHVGTIEAAERAESLLRTMPKLGIRPNVQSYSACISCWANASTPTTEEPAHRAEALFKEMKESGDIDPDIVAYTTLMKVWANHGKPLRAQDLLEELFARSQSNSELKPNVQTFSTVMSAWSHSQFQDAPERTEFLLKRMAEYGVEPNVVSYSTVLDAWAKSNKPQAPDRAHAILNHMQSLDHARPNHISYTTVVKAYAKHLRAEEAESLVLQMLSDEQAPKPDLYTFSSLLNAWSKVNAPHAAERVERILAGMYDLYDRKVIDRPPNLVCYCNVLSCLARSKSPGTTERAQQIFDAMKKRPKSDKLSPNKVAYNTVMYAWANEKHKDALHKAESLLEELEDLGLTNRKMKPDERSYQAVWKAVAASDLSQALKLDHATRLMAKMTRQGLEPTRIMRNNLRRWSKP